MKISILFLALALSVPAYGSEQPEFFIIDGDSSESASTLTNPGGSMRLQQPHLEMDVGYVNTSHEGFSDPQGAVLGTRFIDGERELSLKMDAWTGQEVAVEAEVKNLNARIQKGKFYGLPLQLDPGVSAKLKAGVFHGELSGAADGHFYLTVKDQRGNIVSAGFLMGVACDDHLTPEGDKLCVAGLGAGASGQFSAKIKKLVLRVRGDVSFIPSNWAQRNRELRVENQLKASLDFFAGMESKPGELMGGLYASGSVDRFSLSKQLQNATPESNPTNTTINNTRFEAGARIVF